MCEGTAGKDVPECALSHHLSATRNELRWFFVSALTQCDHPNGL